MAKEMDTVKLKMKSVRIERLSAVLGIGCLMFLYTKRVPFGESGVRSNSLQPLRCDNHDMK